MELLPVIQETFRQVFDDDQLEVTPETGRGDIEDWDSVAQVKLILTLEEEFDVRFTEDEVSESETVGDLLKAIEKHKGRDK
ncbi:MAG: acyl carrier protein [Pirellulales bacterium]|nr:acyl carrier protein [Pirellulales bacterium]